MTYSVTFSNIARLNRATYHVVFVLFFVCAAGDAKAQQQFRNSGPPSTLGDPRLAQLQTAAVSWKQSLGSERQVIDQVCLVPDELAFYEALSSWTDTHYFPILIDNVDLTYKFIQAFRPARIVRFPRRPNPDKKPSDVWSIAEKLANSSAKPGVPGLVVSRPQSPALPGLTALARGRFQRLIRIDTNKNNTTTLSHEEMTAFSSLLEVKIRQKCPNYNTLGDDCDFLTLAGDLPYQYESSRGPMAVDDRIGRSPVTWERWAFSGRLLGDPQQSVYAAMCSLFLQPTTALTFNSYSETSEPWSSYTLQSAADHLRLVLPTRQLSGQGGGSVQGWHEAFAPFNRFGLLMINTHGSPRIFNLIGGQAHAYDVMPSVPTAVCIIHSFSAAEPWNPDTIAGRWLAQGAYLYHGAMDEPFLNSFRLPVLTAELLQRGFPFSAALRPLMGEPFGEPWKLVLLGDPLYSLKSALNAPARSTDFGETANWVVYQRAALDQVANTDSAKLAWAVTAILASLTSTAPKNKESVLTTLIQVKRENLSPRSREVLDLLAIQVALQERKLDQLKLIYAAIPRQERGATVERLAISAFQSDLGRALALKEFESAAINWISLMDITNDIEFKRIITQRVGSLADASNRDEPWLAHINRTRARAINSETTALLDDEIRRLSARKKAAKTTQLPSPK